MRQNQQTTLRAPVTLSGCGVHSGDDVRLVLHPAEAESRHRLSSNRTSRRPRPPHRRPPRRRLRDRALHRASANANPAAVATIEHLMSALYGARHRQRPRRDRRRRKFRSSTAAPPPSSTRSTRSGSSLCSAPRRYLKVLKPVRVDARQGLRRAAPRRRGFRLDVEIDFGDAVIGRQRRALPMSSQAYRREVSRARTFGFMRDVERLWKAGFALGASLENTVAIGDDGVINPEGLRYPDEFVRHKMLDAVGDLALAGSAAARRLPVLSAAATASTSRSSRPCSPTARITPIVEGGTAPRDRLCRDRQRHRGSGLRARYALKLRFCAAFGLRPRRTPPPARFSPCGCRTIGGDGVGAKRALEIKSPWAIRQRADVVERTEDMAFAKAFASARAARLARWR